MKKIYLNGITANERYTLVDDEDYEYLNQFKWSMTKKGYVQGYIGKKTTKFGNVRNMQMHRVIMFDKLKSGVFVDHINGNKLDNRKCNLRLCNLTENNRNRGKIHFKQSQSVVSKYKGVWWDRTKWRTAITVNNKKIYLGRFYNEDEAAKAYNEASKKYFGEFSYLNNIGGEY